MVNAPRGTHLIWDWNGTLLNDLAAVVTATNASLRLLGGGPVTAAEHRRDFRRPVVDYYGHVLGRTVAAEEFGLLDKVFHDTYAELLPTCALDTGALDAVRAWPGTQSLLSMWSHDDLLAAVGVHGLTAYFTRVDGRRAVPGGGPKAPHLVDHLAQLGRTGTDCVLIGDSLDDADAAAAVGARCVLFTGGFTDEKRLRATGVPVADTLTMAVALAIGSNDRPPLW